MFSTGKKSCKNPQTMVFHVYINIHIIWAYFNSIEIFKLVVLFFPNCFLFSNPPERRVRLYTKSETFTS